MPTLRFEPAIQTIQLPQTARPADLNVVRHTFYVRLTATDKRGSAGFWLLRSQVRIPLRAWMFVCCFCLCCIGSGRAMDWSLVQRSATGFVCMCVCVCLSNCVWLRYLNNEAVWALIWAVEPQKTIRYSYGKQSGTLVCPICLNMYLFLRLRFPIATRGQA
jgi:hypothetical protein